MGAHQGSTRPGRLAPRHRAVNPPLSAYMLPVVKLARPLRRKTTSFANSPREASRLMGCTEANQSMASGPESRIRGVVT